MHTKRYKNIVHMLLFRREEEKKMRMLQYEYL